MPKAKTHEIEIEYETFGSPDGQPLLLVMGLGAQMILWDEEFCEGLARRGHRVIRFDNRDIGLSSKLDSAPVPNALELMARAASGKPLEVPYTLDDMADDAAGLLDALEIPRAHVVGASMGGMIAQTLAIRHPARVASLTSIMSSTGNPDLPPAKPEAMQVLLAPPAADRAAAIDQAVRAARIIGGGVLPFDEERTRTQATRAYDRCFYPEGVARQLAAIVAHGSRVEALRRLRVPALVIHGDVDPLVPVEAGRDTHAAIPDSRLLILEGMGHALPPEVWDRVTDAIAGLTSKARLA
ncbi:MAG: alpha/beta fold hydrolase [Myxococcota bacterium]